MKRSANQSKRIQIVQFERSNRRMPASPQSYGLQSRLTTRTAARVTDEKPSRANALPHTYRFFIGNHSKTRTLLRFLADKACRSRGRGRMRRNSPVHLE